MLLIYYLYLLIARNIIMSDTERKQDLQEQALAKSAVLISSNSLSPYTTPVKGIYFSFSINKK